MRPQSVMLSLLGLYLRTRDRAVSLGSLIDVLGRVDVSEDAVRSTVARMVKRDLLARHQRGRKVYLGLTRRAARVLDEGHRRIWEEGAVNRHWDGTWTIVTFSLPDDRRTDRHELRTHLQWAGFAPLQGGVWIAAGPRDLAEVVGSLPRDGGHLGAFECRAVAPTDAGDLVRRAFDVTSVALGYEEFLRRWHGDGDPAPEHRDVLARQLLLHTDWLQALRRDPHLPAEHLPGDWPADEAERLFRRLARGWEPAAARVAQEVLELLDVHR